MKNYIPLILAVVLGLAAVLAVGRLLRDKRGAAEQTVSVLSVSRDLAVGDTFTDDCLVKKTVPYSAGPRQAVQWPDRARVIGQATVRPIRSGDYVLLSDVGDVRTFANMVAPNEWAVTLDVSGGITDYLQPGDEVAVIATMKIEKMIPSVDTSVAPQRIEQEATLVLFSKVRVLDTGATGKAGGARKIVVGLPPAQAQVLVSAQRRAELTVALRRSGDESALRREDAGMVDEATFQNLFKGIESVVVPSQPGAQPAGGENKK